MRCQLSTVIVSCQSVLACEIRVGWPGKTRYGWGTWERRSCWYGEATKTTCVKSRILFPGLQMPSCSVRPSYPRRGIARASFEKCATARFVDILTAWCGNIPGTCNLDLSLRSLHVLSRPPRQPRLPITTIRKFPTSCTNGTRHDGNGGIWGFHIACV